MSFFVKNNLPLDTFNIYFLTQNDNLNFKENYGAAKEIFFIYISILLAAEYLARIGFIDTINANQIRAVL